MDKYDTRHFINCGIYTPQVISISIHNSDHINLILVCKQGFIVGSITGTCRSYKASGTFLKFSISLNQVCFLRVVDQVVLVSPGSAYIFVVVVQAMVCYWMHRSIFMVKRKPQAIKSPESRFVH